jgi:hypothetical protein
MPSDISTMYLRGQQHMLHYDHDLRVVVTQVILSGTAHAIRHKAGLQSKSPRALHQHTRLNGNTLMVKPLSLTCPLAAALW